MMDFFKAETEAGIALVEEGSACQSQSGFHKHTGSALTSSALLDVIPLPPSFAGRTPALLSGVWKWIRLGLFAALASAILSTPASATIILPVGDKYMYPFIIDDPVGGLRAYASAFGAYGAIDTIPGWSFDDRDGQFFLDFATHEIAPPAKGPASYRILGLTLTIVVQNDFAFRYDPSFDLLSTYNGTIADSDPGRPMELYGVGYRAGWARSSFNQDSPFQTISAEAQNFTRVRNVYALDFSSAGSPRDVSNNVEENFETNPWAVADSPGFIDLVGNYVPSPLQAEELVPEGSVFRFDVNLSNPHITAYLQDSLNAGRLHLMVSSLYGTSQASPDIPKFYTREIGDGYDYLKPQLKADILVVPAPAIEKTTAGFRISYDTVSGQSYQVQYTDRLSPPSWQPAGVLHSGTGSVLSHEDANAGQSTNGSRFYRVLVTKNQ